MSSSILSNVNLWNIYESIYNLVLENEGDLENHIENIQLIAFKNKLKPWTVISDYPKLKLLKTFYSFQRADVRSANKSVISANIFLQKLFSISTRKYLKVSPSFTNSKSSRTCSMCWTKYWIRTSLARLLNEWLMKSVINRNTKIFWISKFLNSPFEIVMMKENCQEFRSVD